MTVGDFDLDGNLDVATARGTTNQVTVLLGNGNGTLDAPLTYPLSSGASYPMAIATGDFNGDHLPDLVTANDNSQNVSVLLGNGNGTFGTSAQFPVASASVHPRALAVGDLNGDGRLDLAVGHTSGNGLLSVLFGTGTGSFSAPVIYTRGTGINDYSRSVVIVDVNHDGKPDVVTANQGTNTVAVLINNGSGVFSTINTYTVDSNPQYSNPFSVAAADLNGDGNIDLAVANPGYDKVSVLLGNGTGSFGTGYYASAQINLTNDPVSIVALDLDSNGTVELATANQTSNNVTVFPATGTGTFGTRLQFPVGTEPWVIAAGDFNNDGSPDLATVNQASNTVSILLNNTAPNVNLTIDKSHAGSFQQGQHGATYTIQVGNTGYSSSHGQVTVTDTLPAGLTATAMGGNGWSCVVSTLTCTRSDQLTPGGAFPLITVTVDVATNAPASVTNTASAAGGSDPTPVSDLDLTVIDPKADPKADVQITKIASPTNPAAGDTVTYTLKAKNNGPDPATNVVVSDTLPAGVSFVDATVPCSFAAGTVSCPLGFLAVGQEVSVLVHVKVNAWGSASSSANHLLDVQKVETQIDLNPGETKAVQAVCPSGYFASDGSVRIDHIDQGTGDWTAPEVLESRASSLDTWQGTVHNSATGRAQAKIFAVCISKQTVADGGHQHDLIVSAPITVTNLTPTGKNEATLQCGPGQIAIQPGFNSSVPADLVYSEPEGNGWKFILDTKVDGQATFSIRCMTRQVSVVDGHTHDLAFQHIVKEFTVQPGEVNEAQLTCADGYKGIVADMDLDDGLVSLGNDPRPVTRAFKLYNPTDHALNARLSLLCLGLRTAGEHVPPKVLENTAYISTTSFEEITTNNHSTATVTAEDTDNHQPIPPTDPVKPTPNNPIAKTIVGKGVSYSASGVTFTLKCSGACGGTAKLTSLKRVKVKGKSYRRGTVLAKKQYFIGKAGTRRIKLKLTRAGKGILKSGKVKKGALRISGDLMGRVQIK